MAQPVRQDHPDHRAEQAQREVPLDSAHPPLLQVLLGLLRAGRTQRKFLPFLSLPVIQDRMVQPAHPDLQDRMVQQDQQDQQDLQDHPEMTVQMVEQAQQDLPLDSALQLLQPDR